MDLVQTIRKEGSRGGRADFKWEDVKNDAQRENYLGHSLMAPVGRWQQGRDLNWYAKGDADSKEAEAARIAEEKRKLKEAEEDAMLAAMGLPVPVRGESNANLTPLGKRAHEADVKDALDGKVEDGDEDRIKRRGKKERSRRHRDDDGQRRRHRSRSRSRDHHHRDRRHRHRDRPRSHSRDRKNEREARRHKHRSHSREHKRREDRFDHSGERDAHEKRPRSRSRDRRRRRDSRSKSPYTGHDRRRD